jgi:predicted phosphodiesterase
VIAGDLATFTTRQKVIDKLNDKYKGVKYDHLIVVWGNHDYYVTDKWWWRHYSKQYKPPSRSDNFVKIIGDVAFICTPMWTRLYRQSFISVSMNDYNHIKGFTTQAENELFDWNYQWILDRIYQCKSEGLKTVVVTHHGPHPDCIEPVYQYHPLNEAFYCLEESITKAFVDAEPDIWIYGHSHSFDDRIIGKTRFIRNPYGYDWGPGCSEYLNTGFKLNTIVEI